MNRVISELSAIPILLLVCASAILLLRHSRTQQLYKVGVLSGLASLKDLVAPMLMLCISVKMITACGICNKLAELLVLSGIGKYVPADLLPLIITRPLSGSAANAVLHELIDICGIDSFEVFCAAIIMSSGDTCLYIYSTYFSVQSPKKGTAALLLALAVSFFSVIICILICNVRFF